MLTQGQSQAFLGGDQSPEGREGGITHTGQARPRTVQPRSEFRPAKVEGEAAAPQGCAHAEGPPGAALRADGLAGWALQEVRQLSRRPPTPSGRSDLGAPASPGLRAQSHPVRQAPSSCGRVDPARAGGSAWGCKSVGPMVRPCRSGRCLLSALRSGSFLGEHLGSPLTPPGLVLT